MQAGLVAELTAMNWGNAGYSFRETRTYNTRLQLTRQTAQALVGSNWVTDVDLEYRFSATQNNGQITQFKDWMTGEEVTYAYDSLIRLISAATTGPEWGQSYEYDGFGNRTSVTVTKGTAPAGNLTYDGMTNRITNTGFGYDASGNLTAMPGMTLAYDVANRVLSVSTDTSYAYDADNRRVWKASPGVIYFYGVEGRKLGTYRLISSYPPSFEALSTNLYFAGRLINSGGKWVATDRLGSVVKSESERLRYFPWGEEQVTTAQRREKFATYVRDTTGLDYADQRYYSSQHGRFLNPDPAEPGVTGLPQSFNSYSYALSDPVNLNDPSGLDPVTIPPLGPVPEPQCITFYLEPIAEMGFLSVGEYFNSAIGILGVTTFFENWGYTEKVEQSWIGMGWTFLNRWNLSDADKRKYGFTTSGNFRDVILQPGQSGVWSNGQLKANFQTHLLNILSGSPLSRDCETLAKSLGTALGVLNTASGNKILPGATPKPNPVKDALFFASGGVVPAVNPVYSLVEVTTIGVFTFFSVAETPALSRGEPGTPAGQVRLPREPVGGGRGR